MSGSDTDRKICISGKIKFLSTLCLAAFFSGLASSVAAQTASEITPQSFEPLPQRLNGSVVFSGEPGIQAPEGAEKLSVSVASVTIEGELPGMVPASDDLRRRLTSGPIRVSEIFEAASALEAAYVEQGFILARVVLPAQELRDGGSLRLVVVDGFVEDIDTTAVPSEIRDRIKALTDTLIGQSGLQRSELERSLLLAGDTYGVALGSALASGSKPGGTVIVLEPEYKRTTGFLSLDNLQTDALGEWSLSGGVEFNSYFGAGEVLYLRGTLFPDRVFSAEPRNRTLAFGGVVPLGDNGWNFGAEYTDSRTTPDDVGPDTTSRFKRLSLRAFYPVVRGRAFNLVTRASLDLQQDQQDLLTIAGNAPIYEDQTSVLRLSANAAWNRDNGSIVTAAATFSRGLDAFGARTASDATPTSPLSRAGADATFNKLEISASYRQSLGNSVLLSVRAGGQHSFGDPLLTSEQIGLAGLDALSAFDAGTVTGDSGWFLRGELSIPFERQVSSLPVGLRPYVFAAAGGVHRENPLGFEATNVGVSSYGLGVEAIVTRDNVFSDASLRLEVAQGDRDDGGEDGTRISLLGVHRF